MRVPCQVIFFVLTVLSNDLVSSAINLSAFRQEALVAHNIIRDLYCVDAFVSNSTLNDRAQTFAEYLAMNNLFQHSGASGLGENLFALSRSSAITYLNGSAPINSWYTERTRYNYSNPVYSPGTAHFSQLVWKRTRQFGVGVALSSDSRKAIVAANYYPAGNVQGGYVENVLPLCINTVGGD